MKSINLDGLKYNEDLTIIEETAAKTVYKSDQFGHEGHHLKIEVLNDKPYTKTVWLVHRTGSEELALTIVPYTSVKWGTAETGLQFADTSFSHSISFWCFVWGANYPTNDKTIIQPGNIGTNGGLTTFGHIWIPE